MQNFVVIGPSSWSLCHINQALILTFIAQMEDTVMYVHLGWYPYLVCWVLEWPDRARQRSSVLRISTASCSQVRHLSLSMDSLVTDNMTLTYKLVCSCSQACLPDNWPKFPACSSLSRQTNKWVNEKRQVSKAKKSYVSRRVGISLTKFQWGDATGQRTARKTNVPFEIYPCATITPG